MKPMHSKKLMAFAAVGLMGMAMLTAGCKRDVQSKGMGEGRAVATSQATGHEVSIDNFNFTPSTLTVPAGTSVTWVNHDDVPHTVTADDKRFGSKAMDTDERFSHVFAEPGTYSYYCAVHPHMTGQIIVK